MKKMQLLLFFFYEKYAWKNFRIWPYEKKMFFFLKMEIDLKVFEIF